MNVLILLIEGDPKSENHIRNVFKGKLKNNNIWMDLIHNGEGGLQTKSTFHVFFLLLM